MKYIKSYIGFNEALKPSQFRKYVDAFDKERYADIFKELGDLYSNDRNYYRIYIPLIKEEVTGYISTTHELIDKFLAENDCEIVDYVKGVAKFRSAKNTSTIGKLLNKFKNEELSKQFVSDEKRKTLVSTDKDELLVVISRHPYDIAGSDTDRDWTNCMTIGTDKSNRLTKLMDELEKIKFSDDQNKIKDLKDKINDYKEDGVNIKYLIEEVKEGSLISYLVKLTDRNIESPLAVLNIKPFVGENKDVILLPSKNMYGTKRPEFKKTVQNILDQHFNKDLKSLKYDVHKNVYNDNEESYYNFDSLAVEEILKLLNINNYTINSDESIDVNGDVNFYYKGLTKIPLKFNRVSGNFKCGSNQLTGLEGSPNYVGGDFDCSYNYINSLEGSPKEVGGYFDCNNNQLTSLEGCPNTVNGGFNCNYNKLTTLDGCPNTVGGYFVCSFNEITSLEGCPNTLSGFFDCSDNKLISLEGCPKTVSGRFGCNNNQLTSLDGIPNIVNRMKGGCDFYGMGNPIYNVYKLFKNVNNYLKYQKKYNFLRDDCKIVKNLLGDALMELKIMKIPEKIEGYTYI